MKHTKYERRPCPMCGKMVRVFNGGVIGRHGWFVKGNPVVCPASGVKDPEHTKEV